MDFEANLITTGRLLLDRKLAWGTSGNLSARTDADTMLVSASGTNMGELVAADLVPVRVSDGTWSGLRKPSKEVPLHIGIYQQRPDARVVLHSSPHYTTLIACSNETIPSQLFIETMYYLERVAWIDYAHPGSAELGAMVKAAARNAEVIMMRNHGVILFAESCGEAVMRLQTLEMACRMIVEAKAARITLGKIPNQIVREFLNSGRYKPCKPWHSVPAQ
ncbi:MAG: class II aldolase/adducin family protein [Lacunisphaera sp.]|nr:class II aldolase/adducin family protein [Lacunisphaera sp.]